MKFKEYLEKLNNIAERTPESLDYEVVYALDDEGNEYNTVNFPPELAVFEKDGRDLCLVDGEDLIEDHNKDSLIDAVLIN